MANNQKNMKFNRWYVVLGALLIQISLGAIYIYSVFKPALKAHFPAWSATDLALPSQMVLAFFALSMIVSGKIHDKIGPKKTSIAGALILLIGMYVAAKAHTLAQFVVGFGVLGGIGIGAAYVCPIATCVKWFPDKRGLVTGLAVAGFGAGGLFFTPLANYFIAALGIMATFFYLGLIYFCAIVIGAQLMRVPAADYCPSGWTPQIVQTDIFKKARTDYAAKDMIKTRQFWLLWLTYFIGCTAGLLVIMNITNIWQSLAAISLAKTMDIITRAAFADIAKAGAAAVMAVAILNSLGRIVWGKISDNYGREKTLMMIFSLCGATMLLLNAFTSYPLFLIGVAIIGFCFGGFLALYPAITADYFGTKNVGANYGLVFTAYGAGGLLGPWLAPKLMTLAQKVPYEIVDEAGALVPRILEAGSYLNSFLVAGFLCLLAVFLINFLKPTHNA
jgi:OFA family oxalate/formate antiporter-like MFS transporter